MPQEIFDEELEKCMRELMRNSHADYSHVEVTVDAGNVHFTGSIETEEERDHLLEMVRMVQGTGTVMNEVTLKH